jgi:predicted metal-dependent peptidase
MPYMTHQVMTLIPVKRPGLGTMAVDEYCRMYFDPAFLAERDLKHLAFVVLHEAIHVWSRHAKRCVRLLGERPANDRLDLWRLAVDAATTATLTELNPRPSIGIDTTCEVFLKTSPGMPSRSFPTMTAERPRGAAKS